MKNKRTIKILSLILSLVLFVSIFPLQYAFAVDENIIYSDDDIEVDAGSLIEIPFKISDNTGFAGFKIHIDYDEDVLTPVCLVTEKSVTSGMFQDSIEKKEPGKFDVLYSSATNYTSNGTLFVIKFMVKAGVSGTTTITTSYEQNDTFDQNINDVKLVCKPISILVNDNGTEETAMTIDTEGTVFGNVDNGLVVPICISNNTGILGYKLKITYDADKLKPTAVKNSGLFSGNFGDNLTTLDSHKGTFDVVWFSTADVTVDGKLFDIEFDVLTDEVTSSLIQITYYEEDTFKDGAGANYVKVPLECKDISVTLGCDHDWGTGVVTTAATCETDGVRTYTCSVCNATKTEKIDKLGHNFTKQIVLNTYLKSAATADSSAIYYYACSRCDKSAKGIDETKTFTNGDKLKFSVTVTKGTASPSANIYKGTSVTLTANSPESGYKFKEWNAKTGTVSFASKTSATTTFTMPGENVSIEAVYDFAALTGTVSVTGTPKPTNVLTATLTDTNNTGNITFEWYVNDSKVATGNTYTIAGNDVDKNIVCKAISSNQTGSVSSTSITVVSNDAPDAPTGLSATAVTSATASDGKITGVTTAMEYSADGKTWTTCPNGTVTGLAAGTYSVRYKAVPSTGTPAGAAATVEVKDFIPPSQGGDIFDNGNYQRVYGKNRYITATTVADASKEQLGVDKYDTIIVVNGAKFADALSASYLSYLTKAPIILVDEAAKKTSNATNYITENLADGGKVYVIGGTGVVSDTYFATLNGIATGKGGSVTRLFGNNACRTNAAVLEEAKKYETTKPSFAIVCTVENYADALSAGAVGAPIILTKESNGDLYGTQKDYVQSQGFDKVYVFGGTSAVSDSMANKVSALTTSKSFERIAGKNRYLTAEVVAEKFFGAGSGTENVVVAYGENFADALSGGLLAASLKAPLVLAKDGKTSPAANYVKSVPTIKHLAVLGGPTLVTDANVNAIMGTSGIKVVEYK